MKQTKLLLFIFVAILSLGQATGVNAATSRLFFTPSSVTLEQGETAWVDVMVDTGGDNVNAIAAYVFYPTSVLDVSEVSIIGSILTLFAEQHAQDSVVKISGGRPAPGFSGIQKVASIAFLARASSGSATLSFTQDSAVLRDSDNQDSLGLTSSGKAVLVIDSGGTLPPSPSPSPTDGPSPSPTDIPTTFIYNVLVEPVSETSVRISWMTQEEDISRIEFGTTSSYGHTVLDGSVTTEHSIDLSSLGKNTAYQASIIAEDEGGEEHRSDQIQFITQAPQEGEEAAGKLVSFETLETSFGFLERIPGGITTLLVAAAVLVIGAILLFLRRKEESL